MPTYKLNQFGNIRQADILRQMLEAHGDSEECLIWPYYLRPSGYGEVYWNGKQRLVPRVTFLLVHGFLDESLNVLHSCDTPACFCQKHLRQGTQQENIDDMWARGRAVKPCGPKTFHFRISPLYGTANYNAKLDQDKVREIRRRMSAKESSTVLAVEFGVHKSTICRIAKGISWYHVP